MKTNLKSAIHQKNTKECESSSYNNKVKKPKVRNQLEEKQFQNELEYLRLLISKMSDEKFHTTFSYMIKSKNKRIHGRAYTVYPKQQKSGVMFYCEFRKPDGKFSSAKSTGCRNRASAEAWANAELAKPQMITKQKTLFSNYAEHFYDATSPFCQNKLLRGRELSKKRMKDNTVKIKNYLAPYFGKYMLTAIDRKLIDKFQLGLLSKGSLRDKNAGISGETVNIMCNVLREILTQAYKEKLIAELPKIEKVKTLVKQRGVLTLTETKALFKQDWKFENEILNSYALQITCGNLLAACTGLRLGELIALQRSCIDKEYISIQHSWDETYAELKDTKTKKSVRKIPIPLKAYQALQEVMLASKWKDDGDFVFQHIEDRKRPTPAVFFRNGLYEMLNKIGIDETERESRNILFHSWRHAFNSYLINGNIPLFKVQSLTGHVNDGVMSKHYYHADEMTDVLALQNKIFA